MLTNAQLGKMNTKRLISLLKSVRIQERIGRKQMSCECCGEYLGNDREGDYAKLVRPFERYAERIKAVLGTREHLEKKVG